MSSLLFSNILGTIGRTPVVRVNRLLPKSDVNMFVKVESTNPMSSVKDRLALAVIEDAERKGALKPGQTVVEATSGNTGIALAMVCAVKGYPFVAVMAESFSIERRKLMKFLGAKLVLTPAAEKGTGMTKKAAELAEKNGWFRTDQFENMANPAYHSNTTASEILQAFVGTNLDGVVAGWGTGGTMSGISPVLRAARPDIRIVTTEPEGAQLLGKGKWEPHKIQGWTPDFMPGIISTAMKNGKPFDANVPVTDDEAIATSRLLATKEGIFCGISSGGAYAAALKYAENMPAGSNLLTILPDTGERYLSTPLFKDIDETGDD
eukprot:CAMPEP_0201552000 /NCGR_PEP_ID=MMETSP0173_2-20130828/12188_1 /ASSEMBLY_ACC=CAM_ASM_000268 /TAXON_ID=218659 /ORGANISM="Vexillifera sp., Strain DIVA3 564/2" /LENGTH=320 /DNA_ID=CAMNT_0047962385 /DNA_START=26 /DNA_END=985 /DNA_ORIENTATION=+